MNGRFEKGFTPWNKGGKFPGQTNNGSFKKTHGMEGTKFYRLWSHMKERCDKDGHNKYYKDKGITYELRWEDFNNFKDDMYEKYKTALSLYGDKIELDRIDGSKNYSNDNCRFITKGHNTANQMPRKRKNNLPCGVEKNSNGSFRARIWTDRKGISLGSKKTPEEAHQLRIAAFLKKYKELPPECRYQTIISILSCKVCAYLLSECRD